MTHRPAKSAGRRVLDGETIDNDSPGHGRDSQSLNEIPRALRVLGGAVVQVAHGHLR
jgi:hypothetical protein